jgi:hypothetical protein
MVILSLSASKHYANAMFMIGDAGVLHKFDFAFFFSQHTVRMVHTSISARHATDDNDTAIHDVLGRRIGILALLGELAHGWGSVLEREKGSHAICLETFLQIIGRGRCNIWGTQETSGRDPNV